MSEKEETLKEVKKPDPEGCVGLGDDDWGYVPLFCVDRTSLLVIVGVVVALSVLVWKMIL